MIRRIHPLVFAAIYAIVAPLTLGILALWPKLNSVGVARLRAWQGLEAGLIAIVAALIGAYFVFRQTTELRRQESERLSRLHSAARAVLPLALSSLTDYCDVVAESLSKSHSSGYRQIIVPTHPYSPPQFEVGAITALRDVIESANPIIGERVASVISDVQILASRLGGLALAARPMSRTVPLRHNAIQLILNAATIHARVSILFQYARRETEDPPPKFPNAAQLISSINLLGFDEDFEPDLYRDARLRAERWMQQL